VGTRTTPRRLGSICAITLSVLLAAQGALITARTIDPADAYSTGPRVDTSFVPDDAGPPAALLPYTTPSAPSLYQRKPPAADASLDEIIHAERGKLGFTWPVASRVITSPFGPRGKHEFHHGTDIACDIGDPIRASVAGLVLGAGKARWYGNVVLVQHANGYATLYAHLSAISVAAGATVTTQSQIGVCGSTGRSTGPHLHFEIRDTRYVYDPLTFLP